MTPEALLRSMMLCFPSESSDRISCLVTAFSRSSSMHWVDGEIESEFDYDRHRQANPVALTTQGVYDQRMAKVAEENAYHLQRALENGQDDERGRGSRAYCPTTPFDYEFEWRYAEQQASINAYVYGDIDYLIANGRTPKFLHDISYESLLLSMPDNVSDEWLAAAEDLCHALEEAPHSSYMTEGHLNPKPFDYETTLAQAKAVDKLFDKEILSDEEYGEKFAKWQKSLEEERVVIFAADKRVVESNHQLAKDGRARIEQIKAARA